MFANKNGFTLGVNNPREFAASAFADAQHLLNHALEHKAHLVNCLSTNKEPSPAWTFVTIYYFALFSAMAWTRAANQSVLYLDSDAIKQFCGNATPTPGGGSFVLTNSENSLTGQFEIHITKYKSHFHEGVWAKCMDEARNAFIWINQSTTGRNPSKSELIELRALDLFQKVKFSSGSAWPSKLRNAINYRPGYAYRGVSRNNQLKLVSRLSKPPFSNFSDLIL